MDNNRKSDELSLDELEQVIGGKMLERKVGKNEPQLTRVACPKCGEICMVDLAKSSYLCPVCKKTNYIVG